MTHLHASLVQHARCIYGDEYAPTPPCHREHHHEYFVEQLTFADADTIIGMLRELCPHRLDGLLPVWIRNLAYRLITLQRPDDAALLREAADNLYCHGPSWDAIADDLSRRAEELECR
ncbi:hypothetical protein ACFWCB_17505 [Streptomyces sp. NPDC060048]|uniref:hypothetical protein n=1 Tax=unclassified Streptomyces TaxID=2593676 RepID=UPI0036745CBA